MRRRFLPDFSEENDAHKARLNKYATEVMRLLDRYCFSASSLAQGAAPDPSKQFFWSDYPELSKAMERLGRELVEGIEGVVYSGIGEEWKRSNLLQDLVARNVLTRYTGRSKAGEEHTRYFQTHPEALAAFMKRKERGLGLSDRIWNLEEQTKTRLEMAIAANIAPGTSAAALSIQVRDCLKDPDLMFRRFRYKDEAGEWRRKWKIRQRDGEGRVHFIDCDKETFPTGRGYYKSAYKNAMRLTRTEINAAYRTAEQTRWADMDFVVGYEVKTTQNGKHVTDICDVLSGKYPKNFVFTGWHPQCMCYCVPILKTEEEFLAGPESESANEVTDVPDGFKDWVSDNAGRIEDWESRGTVPGFLRDNRGYLEEALNRHAADPEHSDNVFVPAKTIEEATGIASSLGIKQTNFGDAPLDEDSSPHYGSAMKKGRAATKEAMRIVEDIGVPELTEVQKQNVRKLAEALGIPQNEIRHMSFLEADQGASNPMKDRQNCQSVVVAFEARRRGLYCYALPYSSKANSASFALGERFQDAWINPKTGKVVEPTVLKGENDSEIITKLKKQLNSDGRYVLGINYKEGGGHVVSVDIINGSLIMRDEQKDIFHKIDSIENIDYFELIKIDKAIFNLKTITSILSTFI